MLMSPEMREGLHQSMREGIVKGASIASTLVLVLRERVWECRVDSRGREWRFSSFLEYLTANPPGGLYTKLADIRPLITHDVELLAMFDEETQRKPGRPLEGTVNNVNGTDDRPQGNTKQAAIRRLRKDRPDLLEKVVDGELSAHAAAVEAGFRKKPTPLDVLRGAWKRASKQERAAFLEEVA